MGNLVVFGELLSFGARVFLMLPGVSNLPLVRCMHFIASGFLGVEGCLTLPGVSNRSALVGLTHDDTTMTETLKHFCKTHLGVLETPQHTKIRVMSVLS